MRAPGNIEAIYPLTPVQQGILFHVLYTPDSPLYFQQFTAIVEGDLDVEVLRRSWDVVIGRHQALRSLLTWERRDQPLQIVRETVRAEWRIEDWRTETDPARSFAAFLDRDRRRGFDLSVAPLMRFALFRLAEGRHQFVWSHHHLILDGWSIGVVLAEVFEVYEALTAGRQPDLAPPADYGSYIRWLQGRDDPAAQRFWSERLSDVETATRPAIERIVAETPWAERHAESRVTLAAADTVRLSEAARTAGVTLNTMLRGAWAVLLRRYSGTDDVVFGATVAGRPPELDGALDLVGMFANTLPVRIGVEEGARLADWLGTIQSHQMAALAHEVTPLVDVQRWSGVPAGQPLFTTLLAFENVRPPQTAGAGLRLRELRYLQRSNYPLALLVMPGDEMELIALFDVDRYDRRIIERMMAQLGYVLEQMAGGLNRTVGSLDVIPPGEAEEVLVDWNQRGGSPPPGETMHDLIVAAAATDPDKVAVTDDIVAVTYSELVHRAGDLAAELQRMGVGPNDRVGVCMARSPATVVAILGVLSAGAAYVPMDPDQPGPRHRYVLDDTDAVALLVSAGGGIDGGDRPILEVADDGTIATAERGTPAAAPRAAGPHDLAYVLFTSGSTGRPKGVAVTHGNLVASTHARRDVYPGRVGAFLLLSPLIFDSSVAGLFWTLYDAGTIVLPASRMDQDVRHLAGVVQRHEVTHTLGLPTVYELMLAHAEPGQLASLRVVMVAGEACPPSVGAAHHVRVPGTLLVNEYGPTEATVWCASHVITPDDVRNGAETASHRIPIGRPIPGTQIYLLDEQLRPVPVGVPGELCVAGAGLSRGYLGRPELTAQQFVDVELPAVGPTRVYRSGDLGRHLPDGTIDLLGRLDHQVKIRGQRIEPGEIETVLREHPAVRDAVVVAGADLADGAASSPTLVAYAAAEADRDELRQHLAAHLPNVMVPAVIELLPSLPRGATGKVDRDALPEPKRRPDGAQQDVAVAPATETERLLAGIWADVLGRDAVAVTDNFFELGGDSILSIRIIARAHEAGLTISPRQFFEAPTVAELAASME